MRRYLMSLLMVILTCSTVNAYDIGAQAKIQIDGASHIALDSRADIAAVVSKKNQTLSVVDTKSNAILKQVALAAPPSGVVISNGKIVVSALSGQIWIFEETGEIAAMVNVDAEIVSLATWDAQTVMVACKDALRTVDLSKGVITDFAKVTGNRPRIYASKEKLLLTEEDSGNTDLTVFDKKAGTANTVQVAGNVTGIGFDEQLSYAIATMSGKTGLSLFDLNTLDSVGEIETNHLIANLSVNQSTHTAFMASLADGNMLVVGLEGKLLEKTYPLFDSIIETCIDQSRNMAWVALKEGIALVKLENPVPVLDSLAPDNTVAGNDGFLLSILGSKFLKDTQAWFNNKPIDVLFDSTRLLKSNILPDELIYPGNVTVTAANPPPGGGTSNALTFRILTPIPQVSGVSPGMVQVGNTAVVRVEGKNFLPNAKVAVDGNEVNTYFVSSIVLQGSLGLDVTGAESTHKISVVNTGETVATSNTVGMQVASAAEVQAKQAAATAAAKTTLKGALRGKILNTKKEPVANVTISYKSLSVKTGADGTFILNGIPEGRRTLLIDGSTAIDQIGYYPAIPVTADIVANSVTPLSFTPHLHHQKNHNFVNINQGRETLVTDPEMAGFELRIPKGNRIIGWDGKVNDRVSMRTVPPDRLPIRPLPENTHVRTVTMFFFDKVGGGRPDQPIPFKSPNILRLLPGEKATLWYYDESSADGEAANDWAIAGTGTVSPDGRYIVTDPGVGIPKFCCGATAWGGTPDLTSLSSPNGHCPMPGDGNRPDPARPKTPDPNVGDPVDISTGSFTYEETDMVVPGIIPVRVKRYYVSRFAGSAVSSTGSDGLGAFGKGVSFEYDWSIASYGDMMRLTKPGGVSFDFGMPFPDPDCHYSGSCMYVNTTNPEFMGAIVRGIPGGYGGSSGYYPPQTILTTRDGWVYAFEAGSGSAGGLTSITDRNGNTVTIGRHFDPFDTAGYTNKITTAEGKIIVFHQTFVGENFVRTDSIVGPDGRSVNYTYDADPFSAYPRLKSVMRPGGSTVQYGFDTKGRINTITDGNGVVKLTNVYDSNNRVASQTSPDGGVSTFNYTVAGSVVTQAEMTAPNGSVTSWRFNPYRYGSEYTTSDGTTTYGLGSGKNDVSTVTDSLNRTTSYSYYDFGYGAPTTGMVASVTDPLGNTTNFDYDWSSSLLTKATNALGKSTIVAYTQYACDRSIFLFHGACKRTMITDPLSNQTTIDYDKFGMPILVTDPNGNTSTMTYDANNHSQLLSVADALGNTSTYAYDASGRISTATDAKAHTSSFKYDNADQVILSIDAKGNSTAYTYDDNGNLLTLTDAKGNTTIYQYDNENRQIKATDRLGKSETYAYYTGSAITPSTGQNLRTYTDKRGQVTTFDSFDAMGRLKHVTFADGSTVQYTYDAIGRPTAITDSISGTINYVYDTLDRVTQETTSAGTINYTYDSLGRRTSMTVAGEPVVNYGYDDANHPTMVSKIVGGVLRNYALGYDNAGRRSSLQIPLLATGASISTGYSFDPANRLQSMVHQSPVGVLETIGYQSDPNGNRTSMGRGISIPQATTMSGTSYDNEYEMLSYNGKVLTYDENGNLTTKTDADNNVTAYTWDARNRLVAIDAPTLTTPLHATFQYDAWNRRIGKTINSTTTTFIYDGSDIIQEVTNSVRTNYVRAFDIDEPLSRVIGDGISGQNGAVNHYLQDGVGSVIGIVDDFGNRDYSFIYDEYGNTQNNDGFGFTGRENDGTGLMYYRARYYSPEMRRFVSRDPLGFAGMDINLYAYAGNQPINYSDASGLFRFGKTPLERGGFVPFIPFILSPYLSYFKNVMPYHEQGFFEDGSNLNVGYSDKGINKNDADINNYQQSWLRYDDKTMRQAYNNLVNSKKWSAKQYNPLSHNCQDFTDALRDEYNSLGGQITTTFNPY